MTAKFVFPLLGIMLPELILKDVLCLSISYQHSSFTVTWSCYLCLYPNSSQAQPKHPQKKGKKKKKLSPAEPTDPQLLSSIWENKSPLIWNTKTAHLRSLRVEAESKAWIKDLPASVSRNKWQGGCACSISMLCNNILTLKLHLDIAGVRCNFWVIPLYNVGKEKIPAINLTVVFLPSYYLDWAFSVKLFYNTIKPNFLSGYLFFFFLRLPIVCLSCKEMRLNTNLDILTCAWQHAVQCLAPTKDVCGNMYCR